MLIRKKPILPLLAVCAFFCVRECTSKSNTTADVIIARLPISLLPLRYYLHITTHIHQDILNYSGNVTIDLMVNKPTDEIILHSKLLRDMVVSLTDIRSARHRENLEYSHDNRTNLLRIFSSTEPLNLQHGEQYRLGILYNGGIQSVNFGFYKTIYKDEYNQTIPMGTTQFEPISAREAFPCFDEPSFKSRFIVSVTHGSNYSALSNMPADGELVLSSDGEMATTTFVETPMMPTYLLAFVVSNYKHISELVNGIEHRVFVPPHAHDNGHRALKNAIKSVTALENYLGIKYALPKLDHIQLDKTYGAAMENWGLITYNKKKFLPNNGGKDKYTTLKLIIVQNHEIAHQWFGNLVSPKWWTYAWLNEGFATYFSYIAAELVYPDWRVPEFFIDTEAEVTYNWPINRSMTFYVEKEADIKGSFDVVTYQKAACFIKMFHHAIGQKTFIKGVSLYLSRFRYSVADEDDLFGALQDAINEDEVQNFRDDQAIASVMHSWTHNLGIPIITVIRNYDEGTVTIRQKSTSKDRDETWWIPLNFASASNPNFEETIAEYILPPHHETTISLKDINVNLSNNDWLIVNKQQTGLMHIVYDDRNLELIAEALNSDHEKIHMFNRELLLRDLAAIMDKDLGAVEPLFDILQYLRVEEELLPWSTAADFILELSSNLYGSSAFDMFKAFIRDIIGPIFNKFYQHPKSEDEIINVYTLAKIIDVACQMDLSECLNHTKTVAEQYFFHEVEIENALRDISLCQGIKYSTPEEFQQLLEKLYSSNSSSERYDDIIYSIRCVERPENLKYFLQVILGENTTFNVMSEVESMQFLSFVYVSNYFSRPVILEFIQENYKTMCKRSNVVTIALDRISNYVSDNDGQKAEFLILLDHVHEILQDKAKIENHKIGSRVRKREHFRRKYENDIYAWLKNYEKERTARSASTHRRPPFATARYIVAAGFLSNLISSLV